MLTVMKSTTDPVITKHPLITENQDPHLKGKIAPTKAGRSTRTKEIRKEITGKVTRTLLAEDSLLSYHSSNSFNRFIQSTIYLG